MVFPVDILKCLSFPARSEQRSLRRRGTEAEEPEDDFLAEALHGRKAPWCCNADDHWNQNHFLFKVLPHAISEIYWDLTVIYWDLMVIIMKLL
jgi:hypothetical protein